jgi:NAD(P)-dependent dehydrogenase (short-subunit alcohol dehydrogenase family)
MDEEDRLFADLTGRTALVTGAGRPGSMGAGIAAVLARQGARVALTDVDEAHMPATVRAVGGPETFGLMLDVTAPESVAAAFQSALSTFGGPLDILVNNAGAGLGDDERGWLRTFEINLHGTVRCCEAALASMRPRGYGKIINISSISGHGARGSAGSYGTSKAAVLRYTKGLAFDEAPNGLNINAVCPGAVWTDMQQRSFARPEEVDARLAGLTPYDAFVEYYRPLTPMARVQSPDDVGRAVAFLASDDAAQITGQCLHVDGGAIR